jgi:hypothetical protein
MKIFEFIMSALMWLSVCAVIVLAMATFVGFSVTLGSPVPTVAGALLIVGTTVVILLNCDPFEKKNK